MPTTNPSSYHGFLGILLIPDRDTAQQASALAQKYLPQAEYRVAPAQAHVTLYQARFVQKIPSAFIHDLLTHLREDLVGQTLMLNQITTYGDYLFWNIEEPNDTLLLAHYAACSLAAFFQAPTQDTSTPSRTNRSNIIHFGHTLVGPNYLPHLTLGADAEPIKIKTISFPQSMIIKQVVLARIGTRGKLDTILL